MIEKLAPKNPNIEVLGEFVNSRTPILCRCKLDGYEWTPRPNNLLQRPNCPRCSNSEIYTTESFKEKAALRSPSLEVLGEYTGALDKIKCRCKGCGYEMEIVATALVSKKGHGCNRCNHLIHKTTEMFAEELAKVHPDIRVIGEYKNAQTPIKLECMVCHHTWESRPTDILSQKGCPACSLRNRMNLEDDVYKRIKIIHPNITITSPYIGTNRKVTCVCGKGHEWEATPHNLLGGYGCPYCHSSQGENLIDTYLKSHEFEYVREKVFPDCRDTNPLPFDFYIPSHSYAIEYDGPHHYKPFRYYGMSEDKATEHYMSTVRHDDIKNRYCEQHNIKLIRIPYTETNNIPQILDKYLA